MRSLINQILREDPELSAALGDRWFSSGGFDAMTPANDPAAGMERPFGTFRIAGTFPGIGKTTQRSLEVWVHDETGSYVQIDRLIQRIKELLTETVQVQNTTTGAWIQEISWVNDSPDLFDDARRTNTKMASFNLVGSGA